PDHREVRAFLARTLPPYMLPARVHFLPALPLTGTGKIDRNHLTTTATPATPAPGIAAGTPQGGAPPATPTEHLLARTWSALLDVPEPEISREDDFFILGGDSITVLEMFSRLRDEFPALPRPTTVYTHRTLTALAAAIDDTAPAPAPALSVLNISEPTRQEAKSDWGVGVE
ncbi:phosphopantetheine-binding protein, partial [Streptomyces brasiliscabiei]|uniref:phosphopantetheine-binding protein n=1 Tax=Streptomyces brasiliscabiei TaxID=2736302 RepID=UPI001F42D5BE